MIRNKFLPILVLTVLITSCTTSTNDEELYGETVKSTIVASKMESELLILINDYRTSEKLNTLQLSDAAYKYANEHTVYMINLGEINHDNFSTRASNLSAETNAVLVSENVAKDYPGTQEAFDAWINSPGHRKNIVGDYTHTGICVLQNSAGNYYYTQMFYK